MNNSNQTKERDYYNQSSSNGRLPLINGGGYVLSNQIDNQLQKRTQSRQKEFEYLNNRPFNIINNPDYFSTNISNTPSLPLNKPTSQENSTNNFRINSNQNSDPTHISQNDFLLHEINNTKRLVKNILENHTEMQSKIIEYNKIIQEQDNILRLNNIKLNEHDSKLTEILIAFNNYLNLNEKTNRIINDLSAKCEDFTKKSEYTELKSFIYNTNKNNEAKIFESFNKIDELSMKTAEIKQEQDLLQRYTLDKLKAFQSEIVENRLQQQQHLIQLEESKEGKINQQIDQLKGLIKINENNLQSEGIYRKNMIENLSGEINLILKKKDEKILNVERNQLECERKLISINKDYISTFQELISKNNEKYEIESKTIKSLMDMNFRNLNQKIEEIKNTSDDYLHDVKSQIADVKNVSHQLEIISKENQENFENKIKLNWSDVEMLKEKTLTMYETFPQLMKENLQQIDHKLNSEISLNDTNFSTKLNELSLNWQIMENQIFKTLSDMNEKFEIINKSVNELQLGINGNKKNEKISLASMNNFDLILLEKKFVDRFDANHKEIADIENKIISYFNFQIDQIKKNNSDDQNNILKEISEKLEIKINLLRRDIENLINESDIIKEGRIQEYIVESEGRIRKKINERLKSLNEKIENNKSMKDHLKEENGFDNNEIRDSEITDLLEENIEPISESN